MRTCLGLPELSTRQLLGARRARAGTEGVSGVCAGVPGLGVDARDEHAQGGEEVRTHVGLFFGEFALFVGCMDEAQWTGRRTRRLS